MYQKGETTLSASISVSVCKDKKFEVIQILLISFHTAIYDILTELVEKKLKRWLFFKVRT